MAVKRPNFTPVPNELLDVIMKDLKESELKVVFKICRNTFGWQKDRDMISLTQLEESTGLSRQAVISAIKSLAQKDVIEKRKGRITEYSIKVKEDTESGPGSQNFRPEVVKNLDRGSQNFRPELVKNLDPQKKKEILTKEKTALHNEVRVWFEQNNKNYYHDGKQAGAIEKIIKRLKDRETVFKLLKKYKIIKEVELKNEFWLNSPLTASQFLNKLDFIISHRTAGNAYGESMYKKL